MNSEKDSYFILIEFLLSQATEEQGAMAFINQ